MVKSIAIASGKGGVGKTSLAVNCSVQLSSTGKSVALLDGYIDPSVDVGRCRRG